MDPNSIPLSPQSRTLSHLAEPFMEDARSPSPQELARDSPFSWSQVPSSSLADPDWFWDEHIQAKRARVETIVQGMCLSPSPLVLGSARSRDSPRCQEKARERKRKQSLPMQQGPLKPDPARARGNRKGLRGPCVREQLHLLKQQLRHLQERILQATEKGKSPLRVRQRNGHGSSPWTTDSDHHQGFGRDLAGVEKHRVSEIEHEAEEPGLLSSGAEALLEVLREELTRAVSQAVDSVLQKVLLDPPAHLAQPGRSFQGLVPEGRSKSSSSGGGACKDLLPLAALPRKAQPQAGVPLGSLSLAKPLDSPRYPVPPRMIPKSYQDPPANCPSTVPSRIQENQILSQLLGHGPNGYWGSSPPQDSSSQRHASSESALRPWGAVRLRPWALSQQQYSLPFPSNHLEPLPLLPSVKMEQDGLQAVTDALPFSSVHIQEGLNPGHLKKAKLMFFFTRYPSSGLLKAYFPDVQFNRCITSQLIKWFSNFREFYYIQMEKFARQAISEGVKNPKMLVVLRDSELFRVLNMHYNKGNDFQAGILLCQSQVCLVTGYTFPFLPLLLDCDHKELLIDIAKKDGCLLCSDGKPQTVLDLENLWEAPSFMVPVWVRVLNQILESPPSWLRKQEVPDCFLEIASLTLQEFFRAVSAGKDSDLSWKKPIYKIISKLDSDIPEIFKSFSYPQELFQS